jgi:hypothetical protein
VWLQVKACGHQMHRTCLNAAAGAYRRSKPRSMAVAADRLPTPTSYQLHADGTLITLRCPVPGCGAPLDDLAMMQSAVAIATTVFAARSVSGGASDVTWSALADQGVCAAATIDVKSKKGVASPAPAALSDPALDSGPCRPMPLRTVLGLLRSALSIRRDLRRD